MLTPIESLEKLGYCKLEGIYTQAEIDKTLELLKPYDKGLPTGAEYERSPRLNRIASNVYNLQNKDIWFLRLLFKSNKVEEILKYFLNDQFYHQIPNYQPNYIMRSFGARSTGPEMLPWHIDSLFPYEGPNKLTMQVAIFLEDSTIETGCTHVVEGSHLSGRYATTPLQYESTALEAKAGDILIWDGRIWHATSGNTSGKSRWAMIATFSRWFVKQHFNVPGSLPPEIFNLLSPKERAILGYSSIPPLDENDRLDIKKGY